MRSSRARAAVVTAALAALVGGAVALPAPAYAHFATIAFSEIAVEGDELRWDLYFDPYHVIGLVSLDEDGDRTVSEGEVAAATDELGTLAVDAVTAEQAGRSLSGEADTASLIPAGGLELPEPWRPLDDFPLIHVPVTFPVTTGADVQLGYPLLEHEGVEEHQNVTVATTQETEYLHVFEPNAPDLVVAVPEEGQPGVAILLAAGGGAVLGAAGMAVVGLRRRRGASS